METLTWESVPDYGDLLTKEDFIKAVNTKCLIDYDGWGNYSNEKEMSNVEVYPSLFKRSGWDDRFTHVVWFNR